MNITVFIKDSISFSNTSLLRSGQYMQLYIHFMCIHTTPLHLSLPSLSAVLTEQFVVAHQQLNRGELMQAGLYGALFRAGGVTVTEGLEGPLMVLTVSLSDLGRFLWAVTDR